MTRKDEESETVTAPLIWVSPAYVSAVLQRPGPMPVEGSALDVLFACDTATDGIPCGACDSCRGFFEWRAAQRNGEPTQEEPR